MKKLLLSLVLLCGLKASAATIVVNATTNGFYLISTNRASVYSIQLTGANGGTVRLFDSDTVADPYYGTNYVNAAYTTRILYATNLVTSYVGSNGYTNWYTNAGIYSLVTTNAANTNVLPVVAAFSVAAGQQTILDTDALFVKGITAIITTNVTLILNYRSAQ